MSVRAPRVDQKVVDAMCRRSLAFFASEKLIGDPEPPFSGRFLVAEHHEAWSDLICNYDRVCIEAARGHGKCMTGDALILRSDGALIRHDEWQGGEVYAYVGKQQFEAVEASAAESQGLQPCLTVRTRSGRQVTVTTNHPLLVEGRGWVEAADLVVGDCVAVPAGLSVSGSEPLRCPWTLGLLIGDGSLQSTSSPTVTTADQAVVFALTDEVEAQGWHLKKREPLGFALIAPGTPRDSRPKAWIRELGLLGRTSHTKRVPSAVFQAPPADVAAFLAGYFDADGSVNKHGGGALEYYSVSEGLLRDVQHLLLRFGVRSTLAVKRGRYRGAAHLSWRLTIRGGYILRFAGAIRPRGQKAEALEALARDLEPKVRSINWNQCAYEPIVDIEDAGEQEVYAIHVQGPENYIANDVVNHNSHFFTLALPLWDAFRVKSAGLDPPDCVIFSASQRQAQRLLKKIQIQLETNPKLAHLLPGEHERQQWSTQGLRLANGYTINASGYGTKVRGGHPRLIVVDDGFNDNTAYSELVRAKEIDYFFQAIRPMLIPGGKIAVVGTPLHRQDLYALLSKNPQYEFRRYPAIRESGPHEGGPLWPELYSMDDLRGIEEEIKSIRFTREYLCQPVADGSSLFPRRLFEGDGVEQPDIKLGMPLEFWQRLGVQFTAIGVDFGLSSSVSADYTVVWTMGLDSAGNRWIMDIYREKGLEYTEQKKLIVHAAKRYQADLVYVESNQAQRIYGDELRNETDLPIQNHNTGENKHSQVKGLPALRVLLENKKYRLPLGDERSRKLVGAWIEEMQGVTVQMGKVVSLAEHDDLPMANWICERAFADTPFDFSFGEEEGDREAFDELMRDIAGTGDPADPDYIEDDAFVLGTQPAGRGRPPTINARAVDGNPEDVLQNTQPPAKNTGYPFGAPTAAQILGGGF